VDGGGERNSHGPPVCVHVDKGNKPKPAEATLHALNISRIFSWDSYDSYFGLFASKYDWRLPSCQLVIYSWSLTVERLSKPKPMPAAPREFKYAQAGINVFRLSMLYNAQVIFLNV
jgi:hypothetical protein